MGNITGIFRALIHKGFNHTKHFFLAALYFLATAIVTGVLFNGYVPRVFEGFVFVPVIVLIVVVIAHIALYLYLPKRLNVSKEYFLRYPTRQFLQLDPRRLVFKTADIVSQQLLIVLLVLFLQDAGLRLPQVILAFAIIFSAFHVPLTLFEKGKWPAWYFTAFAMLSAVVFPILILKVQYGFVYSFIIHWVFYTATAVGFWMWRASSARHHA